MKIFAQVMKILAVLAAIAGVIYIVATYGDKIVACAKDLLERFRCKNEFIYCEGPDEESVQAEEADFEE